jgi:hypothetical protein
MALPTPRRSQIHRGFVNSTRGSGAAITVQIYCPIGAADLSGVNQQVLRATFNLYVIVRILDVFPIRLAGIDRR